MSDRKINIIITLVVLLSIVASILLMYYSPKKNNTVVENNKDIDKIAIFNEEVDKNRNTAIGHFTITIDNYELNKKNINMEFNVKKNKDNTFTIEKVLLDEKTLNLNISDKIIDFELGTIKEDKKDIFMYIITNKGTQDGEGDVIIINNNGDVLYQNQDGYLEILDDEKYLVKEKYCDLLINLSCENNNLEDLAFKNLTFKSINYQLVNIDLKEVKVKDICYN